MTILNGFDYNDPSDTRPWGPRESQCWQDMIRTVSNDIVGGTKDTSGHKHNKLYDGSANLRLQISGAPSTGHVLVGNGSQYADSTLASNYVGYYRNAFTNVKDALDSLLRQPPTITGFSGGSTNEKGQTITTVNTSWTISGDTPTHSTLTDVLGFDINTAGGSHSFTSLSLTTDYSYTLTVGDNVANPTSSATTTVHFTQKLYYGNNANTSLNSAQVIALGNIGLTDTRLHTLSMNGGGNYLYISYPVAYGVAAIWVSGLLDNSWIQSTVSVTNASGATENFYVYRSLNVQVGSGIPVQIQ
jgi:hypothetical protein